MKHNQSNVMSQSHTSDQQKLKMNQQSKSLYNSFPKIFQNTKDFEKLEYLLQMKLQNYQVKVKVIYKIENESNNSLSSNGFRLDSWLFIDKISTDIKIGDILKTGFHFKENQGQIFSTGMMKLPPDLLKQVENASTDQQRTFEIMVCEIAPGSSYVNKTIEQDTNILDKLTKDKLPEGFDSFVIQYKREGSQEVLRDEDDIEIQEDEDEMEQYLYEYILFATSQVKPKYVMQVEIRMGNNDQHKCISCDIEATHYCFNDAAYFCASCDQIEHAQDQKFMDARKETNTRRIEHERVQLYQSGNGPPIVLPMCTQHQGNKTELYCTNCHEALCVLCVIGNDGKNNNQAQKKHQNHRICQLKQVYDDAKMDTHDINQDIEGRNSVLKKELDKINEELMKVHKKSKAIIEEIYQKHVATLEKLQSITVHKIDKLQSMQMEVQRQMNQLDYGEEFLKTQLQKLDPISYLKTHTRHVEYRKEVVAEQKDGSNAMIFKPCDLSVTGKIDIEDGQKNYSHSQQNFSNYEQVNPGPEPPQNLYRKDIMSSQNLSHSNEPGFFGGTHFSTNNQYEQQHNQGYTQQHNQGYTQQHNQGYSQQHSQTYSQPPFQYANSNVPTQKQPSGVFGPKKSNLANKNPISQFDGGSTAKRDKMSKVAFQ